MDTDIPDSKEWDDSHDVVMLVNEGIGNEKNISNDDEDEDITAEVPPTIIDAMEMVR